MLSTWLLIWWVATMLLTYMIPFECHHAKFICHILMHTCNANLNFTHNLNIEFWCNVIFMLSFIWCLSLIWPIHTSLNPRVKVFPVFPSCRIFDRGKERGKLEKENLAHTRQKTRKFRERKRQRKKEILADIRPWLTPEWPRKWPRIYARYARCVALKKSQSHHLQSFFSYYTAILLRIYSLYWAKKHF